MNTTLVPISHGRITSPCVLNLSGRQPAWPYPMCDTITPCTREVMGKISACVEMAFGLTVDSLIRDDRGQPYAFARQVAMFLGRKTGLPLRQIARYFGKKDHGTVIYAIERVSNRMETEPQVQATVNNLLVVMEQAS